MPSRRLLLPSILAAVVMILTALTPTAAQRGQGDSASGGQRDTLSSAVGALRFRSIGPAVVSGRISDLAVHPTNKSIWYVAAASGGLWKTTNAGTTFSPVFDSQSSYSIGEVVIDPKNPNVI